MVRPAEQVTLTDGASRRSTRTPTRRVEATSSSSSAVCSLWATPPRATRRPASELRSAIEIIAADMVKRNGGEITKSQAVKTLGPWYTDAELIETAREIETEAR